MFVFSWSFKKNYFVRSQTIVHFSTILFVLWINDRSVNRSFSKIFHSVNCVFSLKKKIVFFFISSKKSFIGRSIKFFRSIVRYFFVCFKKCLTSVFHPFSPFFTKNLCSFSKISFPEKTMPISWGSVVEQDLNLNVFFFFSHFSSFLRSKLIGISISWASEQFTLQYYIFWYFSDNLLFLSCCYYSNIFLMFFYIFLRFF